MQDIVIGSDCKVSSKIVADKFNKRHNNVLRDIANLKKHLPAQFYAANFEHLNMIRENEIGLVEQIPEVGMTRDGFMLLAMGFTGKEALAWKVKFIEAFNRMESALRQMPIQKSAETKLLDKPKTAMVTAKVEKIDTLFGDAIYKRSMTRVDPQLLTPEERLRAKSLNLRLQAEGCIKKANKLDEEADFLAQPITFRLIKGGE